MKLDLFLQCVRQYTIPPESPDGLDEIGYPAADLGIEYYSAREVCVSHGMWPIVTRALASALANWIDDRYVLEIMSGPGWLARALADEGVSITATDLFSDEWNARHDVSKLLHPVSKMDCRGAVANHGTDADVLLVSWPPYSEKVICEACDLWGIEKPIIYIGEGHGGCNATDEFFDDFHENAGYNYSIPLMSWPGIHDHVFVGKWTRRVR